MDIRYNFTQDKLSMRALKGTLLGSYIYLGCLCGSGYSCHELSKLYKHKTLHEPRRNLVNTLTKYL